MKLRSKKGFSLVELIIVIAIMGVIVGVAAPALTGTMANANVSTDYNSAAAIGDTVRMWLTTGTTTQSTARRDVLKNTWKTLAEIQTADEDATSKTGKSFATLLNVNQKPAGLDASDYYICWVEESNKILIYVGDADHEPADLNSFTAGTATDPGAYNYDITEKGVVTPGIVYVENVTVEQDTIIKPDDMWKR